MNTVFGIGSQQPRSVSQKEVRHPQRTVVASRRVMAKSEADTKEKVNAYELSGPSPQTFAINEEYKREIPRAMLGTIIRGMSGGLISGYGIRFVKETEENKGKYGMIKKWGYKSVESTNVRSFKRPAEPILFFDRQNDLACRKIREAFSHLDIDAMVYPCALGGPKWEGVVDGISGDVQPAIYDPNSGRKLVGDADEILQYLFMMYGDNKVPFKLSFKPFADLTIRIALWLRNDAGSQYKGSGKSVEAPIEFWAYEGSPFCMIVKETLAELGIPYVQRSCARGSPKRQQLLELRGHFQAPYIEDPNTGVAMFESSAIIEYLKSNYA